MTEPQNSPRRPNVIWIFGDQHRAQALSCAGDPNLNTPEFDRMAREGVYFPAAVSGFPLCCPYRGALVTGLYPHKCVPGHEYPLDPTTPTIAHAFSEAGYRTAYFGKWHLDGWKERDGRAAMHIVPHDRRGGFDEWVGYDNNNSQWDCWVHGGAGEDAFHHRLDGYETDRLTDMLIDFIGRQGEGVEDTQARPFFAVLSVQPPHDPYLAPPEYMARHAPGRIELRQNVPDAGGVVERARRELAGYYAQIENLDWNVGRVRRALEQAGIDEDTYILFFSDHGDMHGSHGQFRKMTAYEEAIRVPLIVSRGKSQYTLRRHTCDVPVNHVDLAPTSLGLCGIDPPGAMDGTDLSACISGRPDGSQLPDAAYLQSVVPTGHGDSVDRPWRGIVTGDRWKYVALAGQPWLMFNLGDDPFEQVNLALNTRYRNDRRRLQDRLAAFIRDTGDEFPLPEV